MGILGSPGLYVMNALVWLTAPRNMSENVHALPVTSMTCDE